MPQIPLGVARQEARKKSLADQRTCVGSAILRQLIVMATGLYVMAEMGWHTSSA